MKNLIKAQIYQIMHTRVYFLVFFTLVLISGFFGASEYLNGADSLDEGQLLTASDLATRMQWLSVFATAGISFFASFICADDYFDKTANIELMSGRMRKQSYFARAALTIIICLIYEIIMIAVPLIVAAVLTGWGDSLPVSAVIKRFLLLLFPYFRFTCLFIMLAYIIKRPGFAFLADYMLINGIGLIRSKDKTGVVMGMNTINDIMHFDEWHVFGLECEAKMVYLTQLDSGFIARCIIVSIFMGIAYLAIGYSYFHKDDLE